MWAAAWELGRAQRSSARLSLAQCSSVSSAQLSVAQLGSAQHSSRSSEGGELRSARKNQSQLQSWGQQGQIHSRHRSCRRPTTAPSRPACPGAQPYPGAAAGPPNPAGAARVGSGGLSLLGGWRGGLAEAASPAWLHPPQITGGFAVTPALGWQRDSRTAAGQWDGSQPRWRLERSGGGTPANLFASCFVAAGGFFFIFFLYYYYFEGGGSGGGGLAPAIKAELPGAAGTSPPP